MRASVAVVAVAAVLAGCASSPAATRTGAPPHGTSTSTTRPTTTTTATTSTPSTSTTLPPVTALPVRPIVWSTCGPDDQCGSLAVPVNYAKPHGAALEMAVERHLAEDPAGRLGSLVIDPGGPGGSGIDDLQNELDALTPALVDDFDIVVFDPRGVQRSDPFTCGEQADNASQTGDPIPTTKAQQIAFLQGAEQYAQGCKKTSGALLPYLGTIDVARDLERLRIDLGDTRLYYMGQSYGTLIGEEYLALFPAHVAAMVLDSPIDPAISTDQMTADQAASFERVLGNFFSWCGGTSACPWRTTSDPTAALLSLVTRALASPGHGYANPTDVYDAVLDSLYSPDQWADLGDALAADEAGDASGIEGLANTYNTSNSTNSNDAFVGVNCLDHRVSRSAAHWPALAATLARRAAFFGPLFAWGEAQCSVWPSAPTRLPAAVTGRGAPPVLVIGTTGDPATPYQWAVNVAHELVRGALVTFVGDYHVAYFYSTCVRSAVDAYFVRGQVPPPATVCTS